MSSFTPRQFLTILAERCPSYTEQLSDCPLASLRFDPDVALRKERIVAMTDEEVDELLQRHLSCVSCACGTQEGIFRHQARRTAGINAP